MSQEVALLVRIARKAHISYDQAAFAAAAAFKGLGFLTTHIMFIVKGSMPPKVVGHPLGRHG